MPATGKFSGPFPPANGGDLHFAGQFARQVIAAPGAVSVRLDSLTLGSAYDVTPQHVLHDRDRRGRDHVPVTHWRSPKTRFDGDGTGNGVFSAVPVDPTLADRFGGSGGLQPERGSGSNAAGQLLHQRLRPRLRQRRQTDLRSRPRLRLQRCPLVRWPVAGTERDHGSTPTPGTRPNSAGPAGAANFNNAGELTGVATIHEDMSYQTIDNVWRNIEGVLGGAARAADFNVYWGAAARSIQ